MPRPRRFTRDRAVIVVFAMAAAVMGVPHAPAFAAPPIGAVWEQLGTDLDGSPVEHWSGAAVAMSANGRTVIVGVPGSARVFTLDAGGWVQVGDAITGDTEQDFVGATVAISADGDTVMVGSPWTAGATDDTTGYSRVYTYTQGAWTQVGEDLVGGGSLAMSDDGATVAIGADSYLLYGFTLGPVRVFTLRDGAWEQVGDDISGGATIDSGALSVALNASGDTLVVGSPRKATGGADTGQVRVYSFNGDGWVQVGADIFGEVAGDWTGTSVAINANGDTIAVGAPGDDGGAEDAGHMRVYSFDGDGWVQVGGDIDGDTTAGLLGLAVAMSADGTTVLARTATDDGNGGGSAQARAYVFEGQEWVQAGAGIDAAFPDDWSGSAVAISDDGETFVVGLPGLGDGGAAQARVFTAAGEGAVPMCDGQVVTVDLAAGDTPTDGADVILGTAGDDVIAAGDGDDLICSGAGNDWIWGQAGNDRVFGQAGDDHLRGGPGNDVVRGGAGVDNVTGGPGDDWVHGGDGDDVVLRGGTGVDLVEGGSGNDQLVAGNGGEDTVRGGGGDDKVTGGPRPDRLYGGPGDDLIRGNKGADSLFGEAGDDELYGSQQPDRLDGGDGADTCHAGSVAGDPDPAETAVDCEVKINFAIDPCATPTTAGRC